MSIADFTWNTVLDEYNDPNWFQTQIWEPFHSQWSGANVKLEFKDPQTLLEEYPGYFPPFSEHSWNFLDQQHEITTSQLDQALIKLEEDRVTERDLEERVLESSKEAAIEAADMTLDSEIRRANIDKINLVSDYKEIMSQIDSLISHTGMSSGYFDQKKQIQLDSVAANINQSNFTKLIATKDADKKRDRAIDLYDRSLANSDLQYDATYNTSLQNIENKKDSLGLSLIKDKLDIYAQWKTQTTNNLSKLVGSDVAHYGEEDWAYGGHHDPETGIWETDIYDQNFYDNLSDYEQESYIQIESGSYIYLGEAIQDRWEMYQNWMGGSFVDQLGNVQFDATDCTPGGMAGYDETLWEDDRFNCTGEISEFSQWQIDNPEEYAMYRDQLENLEMEPGVVNLYNDFGGNEASDARDRTLLANYIFDQMYLQPVRDELAEQGVEAGDSGDYGIFMPTWQYDIDGNVEWWLRDSIIGGEFSLTVY